MHGKQLPSSVYVPSLVSIAQVVFLLECRHTHRQKRKVTDATKYH